MFFYSISLAFAMASSVLLDGLGPRWWFVASILFSPAGKQTIRKCIWASFCAQQKQQQQKRVSVSLAHQDLGEVRILWKEDHRRTRRDVSQAPQIQFYFFPDHIESKQLD